jgi:glucokinase
MNTIGIDIGGTKIDCALVDEHGQILASHRAPTHPEKGLESVLDTIVAAVSALNAPSDVCVGVGCAGYIHQGTVRRAVNLGWHDVPLQNLLHDRLGRDVVLDNDARAALIGEWRYGVARGIDDVVYFAIGTGFGASALSGGRLLQGVGGVAMEIGQLRLDDSPKSSIESWTSGTGLSHIAQNMGLDVTDTHTILARAEAGDVLALSAVRVLCDQIALVALWTCSLLNPQRLIIGGGMGYAVQRWLLPILNTKIKTFCADEVSSAMTIHMAQVTSSAIGAAALAR